MSQPLDFSSPNRLCRWADEEIGKLEATIRDFSKTSPYRIEVIDNYLHGELVSKRFKACEIKKPGEDIERFAYRIVLDLRNALDHAVSAASFSITRTESKYTNFPFATSEKDFQRRIAAPDGPYRGIPTSLHEVLLSFEPFETKIDGTRGNDILCFLNQIANSNKHRVTLETSFDVGNFVVDLLNDYDLLTDHRRLSETEFSLTWAYPRGEKPAIGFQTTADIYLADRGPLPQHTALAVFREMSRLVADAVRALEKAVAESKPT